jgi:hypothetical protein
MEQYVYKRNVDDEDQVKRAHEKKRTKTPTTFVTVGDELKEH